MRHGIKSFNQSYKRVIISDHQFEQLLNTDGALNDLHALNQNYHEDEIYLACNYHTSRTIKVNTDRGCDLQVISIEDMQAVKEDEIEILSTYLKKHNIGAEIKFGLIIYWD